MLFIFSNCILNCVSSFFVYILVNLNFCYFKPTLYLILCENFGGNFSIKALFSVAFYSNCLDRSYDSLIVLSKFIFFKMTVANVRAMEAVIIRTHHSSQSLFYRHQKSTILMIGKLFLCLFLLYFWSFSSTVIYRVVRYRNIDYT